MVIERLHERRAVREALMSHIIQLGMREMRDAKALRPMAVTSSIARWSMA
jgi:hypothetical protein